MSQPRVVIVGSANIDFIMRVPSLPARGETVTDGEFRQVFGGKGANAAVAAARASTAAGRASFIARLGNDPYVPAMLEGFRDSGLDVDHVSRDPDHSSGTALVMFDGGGDNYLTVAPGSNYTLTPAHIDAAADRFAPGVVTLQQMEITPEANGRALDLARERGALPVFNYAPVREQQIPIDDRMHGLVVNETEAEQLSGEQDAAAAAEALRARGPAFVVVTLGAAGALLCDVAGSRTAPGFVVEPVDATAAGDTFCGALAVALAEGRPLDDAARFAQAAAALCVTGFGAQPSIPVRSRIESFLNERL
jgi:ribokinase